jgi:CheY-like chemotaxis protein
MVHVLVVEDDVATRQMLRMALDDAGYGVSEAPNGEAALRVLRASPYPLVVVLDMLMPEGDGLTVLRAVRDDAHLATGHRYLAMSASPPARLTLPPDLTRLLLRPLISKPFRLADVLAAVEEAASQLAAEA